MNHPAALITALLATLALSTPASALELSDSASPSAERTLKPDVGDGLSRSEANHVVGVFLSDYLGWVVRDRKATPKVAVWGCRTEGRGGTCEGRVAAGTVSCAGTFRIRETDRAWWVSPDRVLCASRNAA